ncbi:MAG: ribonuclease Z [Chitinophagales bacterium]|nr:ribonuclease Z [Chitinophagales bacterium]
MTFELTILGANSAKPAFGRHPSAQILQIGEKICLIDCGEGTQAQMIRYGVNSAKINHIFISHLHGDHYLGLIPLLDSMSLNKRTVPLNLYAPPDLMRVLDTHQAVSKAYYSYPIHFCPTQAEYSELVLDTPTFTVRTLPLAHVRMACTGFLFVEKPMPRKMLGEQIQQYNIPFDQIKDLKNGDDYILPDGTVIPNAELTIANRPPYSYAYCSDTAYTETLIPLIKDTTILYHEATYLKDMQEKAAERGHSTAEQAAQIALKAEVKRLIIGHYSSKYANLTPFVEEARAVFAHSDLAIEGNRYMPL